jgi:hypothetical protein
MRRVMGWVAWAWLLGAAAMVVGLSPAFSHTAPSGWSYDYPECCLGRECAQVPDTAVREVEGGYRVTILAGQHPMLPVGSAPVSGFVPFGDARIRLSGDRWRHVCIVYGRIGCVYLPPPGV